MTKKSDNQESKPRSRRQHFIRLTKQAHQWSHMYIYLRGAFDISKNLGQVIQFTPGKNQTAPVLLSQREFWRTGQRMIRRARVHPDQMATWDGIPPPTQEGTYRMFKVLGLRAQMSQEEVDEKIKYLEKCLPPGIVTVDMLAQWHQLLREYRLPRIPGF